MPLAPGTHLGPYEIVAPLGAGGMGEVYRARDARLGRDVAIKGLPGAFAQHSERLARFEREARLLASLNHPNIAAIFGLEEVGGTPYLVLELVEGETLAQRLTRGALSVRETLEVGVQVAAAIDAAHERGIVHRDLKPGNVMLTASRTVKVLDFGLAKGGAAEAASSSNLSASPTMTLSATGAGVILGTAPYMSPEQARGRSADRRADVWALGCLLFECLSGRQAFSGETVSDVIARILEREPDWGAFPAVVPPRLRDVVRRCLTKEADDRPRDIGDLRRELAAIAQELSAGAGAHAAPASALPSLAVLYFENLASDKESEYFCAGITEDILTDLARIKGLRVASRNAVIRYRGAPADIPKIASELSVKAVLEGSVRRAGDRVRISAQLINAADGFHLWADRYDRTLEDVFAVQEEIASAIANALRVTLAPAESASLVKDRPQDVHAYDLYLKGREHYGRYTAEAIHEALALFQEATALDPGYALAWAGIADCYGQLCQWGGGGDTEELTRLGLEAAHRAISLNPRLPEAYKAEALNLRFRGDKDGSRAALIRAVEANPRFIPALINLAVEAYTRADIAGAERFIRRVLEIDPQEVFGTLWLCTLTENTRREEEAIGSARRGRQLSDAPFYVGGSHGMVAWVRIRQGDLAAAEREMREGLAGGAHAESMRSLEAMIAAVAGDVDRARRIVRELDATPGLNPSSVIAAAGAALRVGEPDIAARFMDRALVRDLAPTMVRLEPELHGLLDRSPFAPRRRDAALVWPLEAPMVDPVRHRLFREVRIESGLPQGSDAR